jgi:hypothetical protein
LLILLQQERALEGIQEQPPADVLQVETEVINEEASLALDEIFRRASPESPGAEEVDAFWETLAGEAGNEGSLDPNSLSYEQARQLGLAPPESGGSIDHPS